MAFMVPVVEHGAWFVVECTDGASDVVPADVVGDVTTIEGEAVDVAPFADYVDGTPASAELRECWGARLSAPGYMDCTGWTLHDTEAEARRELRDTWECCPWTGDTLPGPDVDASADPCDCGDCEHDTKGGDRE